MDAKQIINQKQGTWNKITNEIYSYCKKTKNDPYLFLTIYYLEDYLRPAWFRFLEFVLYKTGLLNNPSLGPFQVRVSHLRGKENEVGNVTAESLNYIAKLLAKTQLSKKKTKNNFKKFGHVYNPNSDYGKTLFEMYSQLKSEKWKKST